jgi:iodothyronine deiodinase-like protein
MEKVAKKYKDQAIFLFVYCREAHPEGDRFIKARTRDGKSIKQAATEEERKTAARQFCEDMKVTRRILVDEFADKSVQRLYGGLPNPTIVVDMDGKLALKMAWTHGDLLDEFLTKFLTKGGRFDLKLAESVPFRGPSMGLSAERAP